MSELNEIKLNAREIKLIDSRRKKGKELAFFFSIFYLRTTMFPGVRDGMQLAEYCVMKTNRSM